MTRRDLYAAIAIALAVVALWALATALFTARVIAETGNVGTGYEIEWKGDRV